MLPESTVLNTKTVAEILRMGYTRIPIYADGDRNTVVSLLFVKVGCPFVQSTGLGLARSGRQLYDPDCKRLPQA